MYKWAFNVKRLNDKDNRRHWFVLEIYSNTYKGS